MTVAIEHSPEAIGAIVQALMGGDVNQALRVMYAETRGALSARISEVVDSLINVLDTIDGDPDFEEQCEDEGFDSDTEPNGDEGDFTDAEDEWSPRNHALHAARQSCVTTSAIKLFKMGRDGNVSFLKDGELWIGGRLL